LTTLFKDRELHLLVVLDALRTSNLMGAACRINRAQPVMSAALPGRAIGSHALPFLRVKHSEKTFPP
ncbi:hypothetical protein, partial [Mesorhizobium ciceri]